MQTVDFGCSIKDFNSLDSEWKKMARIKMMTHGIIKRRVLELKRSLSREQVIIIITDILNQYNFYNDYRRLEIFTWLTQKTVEIPVME